MKDLEQLCRSAIDLNDDSRLVERLQLRPTEYVEALLYVRRTVGDPHTKRQDRSDDNASRVAPEGEGTAGPFDTLDQDLLQNGSAALRRLSQVEGDALPEWVIPRFEITYDGKVGVGSLSSVYKGTWRRKVVAIKVLNAKTDVNKQHFLNEVSRRKVSSVHMSSLWY